MAAPRTARKTASKNGSSSSAPDAELAGVEPIVVAAPERHTIRIPIVGLTELIMNKWSHKAKQQMLDKQMGKARVKKDPKDPEKDFEAATHFTVDGGYGFPSTGFKAAIVEGARAFEGITMTMLQRFVYVAGVPSKDGHDLLVPIVGDRHMREDMVRNQTGVADIRYRPGFMPWSAELEVTYLKNIISPETLVALINVGGMCGVGDWRPSSRQSKSGTFGMFQVDA